MAFPLDEADFATPCSGADTNSNAYLTSRYYDHFIRNSDESDASTYCERRTNVFVVVSLATPKPAIRALLQSALLTVQNIVNSGDTGPIPYAGWRHLGRDATSMAVYSEAQYQTTYEILLVAIQELQRWMQTGGRTWGSCSFTIWDGPVMVGQGGLTAVGG